MELSYNSPEGTFMSRLNSFDLIKAFACFLVVWGHIIQYSSINDPFDGPVFRLIYSFHMPLFMIVCGFFSWSSMKLSLGGLLIKKFKQLLLPCVSFGLILYFLIILYHYADNGLGTISEFLLFMYRSFWFLKSLFICYLLAWLCNNSRSSFYVSALVICIFSQFIPIYRIPIMFPCFVAGMFLKRIIDKEWVLKYSPFFLILFIVLLPYLTKELSDGSLERYYISNLFSSHNFIKLFLLRFYSILLGISASLFIISITRKYLWDIDMRGALSNYILSIGKETLGIYLVHLVLVGYFYKTLVNFDNLEYWIFNMIIAPVISVGVLIICHFIIKAINRSRYLSLLLFGTNYVKHIIN